MSILVMQTCLKLIEEYDEGSEYSLRNHGQETGEIAFQIATQLDTSSEFGDLCRIAGIIHDVGKVYIEKSIFLYPGKYTPPMWSEMMKHPVLGEEVVRDLGAMKLLIDAVALHHCRYAGGGYPKPELAGEEIPLIARIICVADYLSACLEARTYRPGLPIEQIKSDMQGLNNHFFDPKILKLLFRTDFFQSKLVKESPVLI